MSGDWSNWIGVMSGTSLDGVDAVLARFRGEGGDFEWEYLGHMASPFRSDLRLALFGMSENSSRPAGNFATGHFKVGDFYSEVVRRLLDDRGLAPEEIAGIGISGQTVYHRSPSRHGRRRDRGVTLQLGCAAVVHERFGVPVVSDFRSADVAAGGEGAPLVPLADFLLLRDKHEGRIILNIGGIANLTAIPAGGRSDEVIAFDTGPGNMVMDGILRQLTGRVYSYDRNGEWALAGSVDREMLERGMTNEFFSQEPPRSTGREDFGLFFVKRWIEDGHLKGLSDNDLVATACALTAESVAKAVREFVAGRMTVDAVYVAGGGAKNPALMKELESRLDPVHVKTTAALGLDPMCREALAFALLAHETIAGRPGNLPQVTGASRPVILGQVCGASR